MTQDEEEQVLQVADLSAIIDEISRGGVTSVTLHCARDDGSYAVTWNSLPGGGEDEVSIDREQATPSVFQKHELLENFRKQYPNIMAIHGQLCSQQKAVRDLLCGVGEHPAYGLSERILSSQLRAIGAHATDLFGSGELTCQNWETELGKKLKDVPYTWGKDLRGPDADKKADELLSQLREFSVQLERTQWIVKKFWCDGKIHFFLDTVVILCTKAMGFIRPTNHALHILEFDSQTLLWTEFVVGIGYAIGILMKPPEPHASNTQFTRNACAVVAAICGFLLNALPMLFKYESEWVTAFCSSVVACFLLDNSEAGFRWQHVVETKVAKFITKHCVSIRSYLPFWKNAKISLIWLFVRHCCFAIIWSAHWAILANTFIGVPRPEVRALWYEDGPGVMGFWHESNKLFLVADFLLREGFNGEAVFWKLLQVLWLVGALGVAQNMLYAGTWECSMKLRAVIDEYLTVPDSRQKNVVKERITEGIQKTGADLSNVPEEPAVSNVPEEPASVTSMLCLRKDDSVIIYARFHQEKGSTKMKLVVANVSFLEPIVELTLEVKENGLHLGSKEDRVVALPIKEPIHRGDMGYATVDLRCTSLPTDLLASFELKVSSVHNTKNIPFNARVDFEALLSNDGSLEESAFETKWDGSFTSEKSARVTFSAKNMEKALEKLHAANVFLVAHGRNGNRTMETFHFSMRTVTSTEFLVIVHFTRGATECTVQLKAESSDHLEWAMGAFVNLLVFQTT